MIVSASYRTDIPAFYGAWFMRRLDAGFCDVTSPYGGRPYRVSLRRADVAGFVFWTKNLGPFRAALDHVSRRGFPFVVQYSINDYPRALETSVTNAERAVAHMRAVARAYGPRVAVWRYDPIVDTSLTPPAWHVDNFARLARRLAGATDEVIVSFAHVYQKTARNLAAAARAHGFAWRDPPAEEKRALLARLAAVAGDRGLRLTLCAQPGLLVPGAEPGRCVDAERLAAVAGRPVAARLKGNRPGCGCFESRDIGAYDSCPHGCVYCYAVQSRSAARARHRRHDPGGATLIPDTPAAPPVAAAPAARAHRP